VTGFCEHGNEPSGSIKCGEFLEWMTDSTRRTLLHEVSYDVNTTSRPISFLL
jgi:hypothetical protein